MRVRLNDTEWSVLVASKASPFLIQNAGSAAVKIVIKEKVPADDEENFITLNRHETITRELEGFVFAKSLNKQAASVTVYDLGSTDQDKLLMAVKEVDSRLNKVCVLLEKLISISEEAYQTGIDTEVK